MAMGGQRPRLLEPHRDFIPGRYRERPETTLHEMKDAFLAERGVRVSHDTVWRFLKAERQSFKKSLLASEADRADVARKRARKRAQRRIDPRRLVVVDETWARLGAEGKGPRAVRHRNTMTFLAALRHDRIEVPWLLDGAIDAVLHALGHFLDCLSPTNAATASSAWDMLPSKPEPL